MKKQFYVVGAVIVQGGEVLCAQRGPGALGGKWEFPGGKIEANETPQVALRRELEEELHVEVHVGDHVDTTTHRYDFGVVTLTTFLCEVVDGTPVSTEHAALSWLRPSTMHALDWAPADLPAVRKVQALLSPESPYS